jgi:hypothetical protein
VPEEKIRDAEREIERRSGRKTVLTVASIASQSELAVLMQRIATPSQPTPVAPQTLDEVHHEVINRIKPILSDVWPAEAPLQDFDIAFNSNGMTLTVQYQSDHVLEKISQGILTKELQERLGAPDISLVVHRLAPPRTAAKKISRKP